MCTIYWNELKQLKVCEGKLIKKLLDVKGNCFTTEIMRSLNINITEERVRVIKLTFYNRLKTNQFTSDLFDEQNSYVEEVNEIIINVPDHHDNGTLISVNERVKMMTETINEAGGEIEKENKTVGMLKKIYNIKNKEKIPHLVNYLMMNQPNKKRLGQFKIIIII